MFTNIFELVNIVLKGFAPEMLCISGKCWMYEQPYYVIKVNE